MKIAFESQLFLKGNKTGIPWFADNIIKELAQMPDCECQCDFFSAGCSREQLKEVEKYKELGISMNSCCWFHNVFYKLLWPFVHLPYHCFFGNNREITQFFNFVVPPGVRGKCVTVIHDMAYMAYPETVNKKTQNWLRLTMKGSCRRADAVVTVSEFSKREIIRYLGVSPEKITVVYNGVDLGFYRPDYGEDQVELAKKKYHIAGEYFLYLGTLEPRKNVERIIEAYALLKEEGNVQLPFLVIAGGKGWLYETIFERVKELDLENQIIFTGYVAERDVPLLMNGARAFLFPSLYEGFGIPPIEAMACGTAVITSNAASLPEVVGEAAIKVDPYRIDELAVAMGQIASDDELRERLRKTGLEHVQKYTWHNAAVTMRALYDRLLR